MKPIDVILIIVLLVAVGFALRSMIRARKNGGGCSGCSGDCTACGRPEAKDKTN